MILLHHVKYRIVPSAVFKFDFDSSLVYCNLDFRLISYRYHSLQVILMKTFNETIVNIIKRHFKNFEKNVNDNATCTLVISI